MISIKSTRYIYSILFAFALLILSIWPVGDESKPSFFFEGMDKLIHGLMYGVFIVLIFREYFKINSFTFASFIYLLILTWVYSILMELLQNFISDTRTGEIYDVIANAAGIILASIIYLFLRRIRS